MYVPRECVPSQKSNADAIAGKINKLIKITCFFGCRILNIV